MPVYVRRRQAATPDTLGEFSTDEEDFVTDPDQTRDLLPQPYRLVAKLLDSAVDDIWELIADREGEREAETRRQLPPQYDAGGEAAEQRRVNCMCGSPDNELLFVGHADGVSALRVDQHADGPVDVWQSADFDISAISCSRLSDGVYLLAANDDLGMARLFAFSGDRFMLLKVMNDTEGDKKVLATRIGLSDTCEFCALALENPGSGEVWLEVHKLPKEAWTKELDGVATARRQAAAKRSQEEAAEDGTSQRSATASPVEEDRTSHKFSAPNLILRCRPAPKITGVTAPSLLAAFKGVDGSGDVLGTGTTHPLTAGHLEARQGVFETLHEQQLQYLPSDGDAPREFQSPSWHFLTNGRSLPIGLELPHNENGGVHTAGLALRWRGGRQMFVYSLLRPAKEVEHRPDQVMPFSAPVSASCVSSCSSLLAVGLVSGHVLVLDWHLGLARRLVHVAPQPVWGLSFLGPQDPDGSYPPYRHRVDLRLLVVMEDKSLSTLFAGSGYFRLPAHPVSTSDKHPHEQPAWVTATSALPGVVIRASHAGVLVLHDVIKERELCRLVMPDGTTVAEPWQPQICFPTGSKTIYVRGQRRLASEEPEDGEGETESVLVALNLSRIPELNAHLESAPRKDESRSASVHPMVVERANALLELRLKTHADRTAKMQGRWHRLRETFNSIQERRRSVGNSLLDENDGLRSVLNSTPLSDVLWQ